MALPFAVGLAIHTQLLGRPNFHIAAGFAGVPLFASWLSESLGTHGAVVFSLFAGIAFIVLLDRAVEWLDRASQKNIARAFFESAVVYLIIVQILLMFFGATPYSLTFAEDPNIRLGSVNASLSAWMLVSIGAFSGVASIVMMDLRMGNRLRMIGGDGIDAIALGLNIRKYALIAIFLIGFLVSISSMARAAVVPFSVYSGFSTYILCFCAATLPAGYRVAWTGILLLLIFVLRSFLTSQLGASLADAFTLTIVLFAFALSLSLQSLNRDAL